MHSVRPQVVPPGLIQRHANILNKPSLASGQVSIVPVTIDRDREVSLLLHIALMKKLLTDQMSPFFMQLRHFSTVSNIRALNRHAHDKKFIFRLLQVNVPNARAASPELSKAFKVLRHVSLQYHLNNDLPAHLPVIFR